MKRKNADGWISRLTASMSLIGLAILYRPLPKPELSKLKRTTGDRGEHTEKD